MPNPEPPLPKKRGCFFYGCITSLVLLLLIFIGLFIAMRLAIRWGNNKVAEYTDTSAMSVPKTDMTDDEIKTLKERVATFNNAVDAHSNTPPLVLTSREINGLLANDPDLKDYKDKFYVSLDGDTINGQVSLPLDGLKKVPIFSVLDLKGRYMNGSGTFKGSMENGALSVFIEDLDVHGKPLPADFIKGLQAQNLAQVFNNDPNAQQPFKKYDSVQVTNSTLIIKAKEN
jgi:hypothetical protein